MAKTGSSYRKGDSCRKGGVNMGSFEDCIEQYGKMVYKYMGLYHISGYDYEDLFNIGFYVMWKCYNNFDEEKGIKFGTYLTNALINEGRRLYRLSTMKKRAKDKDLVGIDNICQGEGDMTYMDVLEDTTESIIDLANGIYHYILNYQDDSKHFQIFKTCLYQKLFVNQDITYRELGQMCHCSKEVISRVMKKY